LPKAVGTGIILIGMELRLQKKVLFIALAVCIVFSVVFAEALIANDLDHVCTEEGCPFCMAIETVHNYLKSLKLSTLAVFLVFAFLYCSLLPAHCSLFPAYSPITQKVRFNS
jgi:hypothetical protein